MRRIFRGERIFQRARMARTPEQASRAVRGLSEGGEQELITGLGSNSQKFRALLEKSRGRD